MADTEVRCPSNPRRMFFKVREDGCLEIACSECRARDRKGGRNVWLVLHVYSPDGDLIDTEHLEPIRVPMVSVR